jgi:hypothetical protein
MSDGSPRPLEVLRASLASECDRCEQPFSEKKDRLAQLIKGSQR